MDANDARFNKSFQGNLKFIKSNLIVADFYGNDFFYYNGGKNKGVFKLKDLLLKDMTTGKNIIWAADDYKDFQPTDEIIFDDINLIQPRWTKVKEQQKSRTKKRAEIFTPARICNLQNNFIDEKYFGRANVFNVAEGQNWTPTTEKIPFDGEKWQEYILLKRLEITCGEAPYLVSRYDAVTGADIPLEKRIGLLDRKFRVINENVNTESDWINWAIKAVQSCYGYEFQGDNLYLARRNIFLTFQEYFERQFDKKAELTLLKEVAEIISWNIWQMDGLKFTIPFADEKPKSLFDAPPKNKKIFCEIKDWQTGETFQYRHLLKGGN